MKVDKQNHVNSHKPSRKEIQQRVMAKFGKDFAELKKNKEITKKNELEIKTKARNLKSSANPQQMTESKLKDILKSGAFEFSDRERKTLAKILK